MAQQMDDNPPAVTVEGPDGTTPAKVIDTDALRIMGTRFDQSFRQYASDRRLYELGWARNLRQYLGIYDPDIDAQIPPNRSRAYPRITRVKCISMLSRVMNLMFPGNERNWELGASPSPEMAPQDVLQAVQELVQQRKAQGLPATPDNALVEAAVQALADSRAADLTKVIDDQLQELGGNQSLDYIALNRQVLMSGIKYGLGLLRGPFVRKEQKSGWVVAQNGQFQPSTRDIYKPQYDFLSIWDFYPDMTAKRLDQADGYFLRMVMGRHQLRELADRRDFFKDQVLGFLKANPNGNYSAREFETELRVMGPKSNVNEKRQDPQGKYEVIVWNGYISAEQLIQVGVDVPDSKKADEIEAEVWLVGGTVIKADMNPWVKLGEHVNTLHAFMFDEDETAPIGNGLPNVMRDSQMSVAAATRMSLDNASVTCGPNLEVNVELLRPGQDFSAIEPYKIWEREGTGPDAQFPAVRRVEIDGHLPELQNLIQMFMQFADMETFIGPATGGDMDKLPSEPFRTAAGASMMKGDAALPFKDVVRNFDTFTQSVIQSLVQFNKKFNPDLAPAGDFNVIARGATSLVAKEVRGMQMDQLASTLRPEEWDHIDERKFVEARLAARDVTSIMVSEDIAEQRKQQREQAQSEQQAQQADLLKAEVRKMLSDAYKNITQGQKNVAASGATTANTALDILERGMEVGTNEGQSSTVAQLGAKPAQSAAA